MRLFDPFSSISGQSKLSLGDVIDPDRLIRLISGWNCLLVDFFDQNSSNQKSIVASKSIKTSPNLIKKFEIDRIYINFFDINQ